MARVDADSSARWPLEVFSLLLILVSLTVKKVYSLENLPCLTSSRPVLTAPAPAGAGRIWLFMTNQLKGPEVTVVETCLFSVRISHSGFCMSVIATLARVIWQRRSFSLDVAIKQFQKWAIAAYGTMKMICFLGRGEMFLHYTWLSLRCCRVR